MGMNNYPQKKIITFNKFTQDFDFSVNVNGLDHLGEKEISYLGPYLNLTSDHVSGVAEAFAKHSAEVNVETKGIKAHFNLDDSGILALESTEAVFEKNFTVEMQIAAEKEKEAAEESEVKAKEAEETWAKLGDKISSFWGGDSEKKEGESEEGAGDQKEKKDKDGK